MGIWRLPDQTQALLARFGRRDDDADLRRSGVRQTMTRPLNITLIEDDREIARGLFVRLTAAGHQATVMHDGATGLAAALSDLPDRHPVDLRLPDMDGFTVLRQLQQHDLTKMIPVIIVSANAAERAKREAIASRRPLVRRETLRFPQADDRGRTGLCIQLTAIPTARQQRMRLSDARKTILIADDDKDVPDVLALRCKSPGPAREIATCGRARRSDAGVARTAGPADPRYQHARRGTGSMSRRACCRIRRLRPVPVVFCTGRSDQETIDRCKELGAHYVVKDGDTWPQSDGRSSAASSAIVTTSARLPAARSRSSRRLPKPEQRPQLAAPAVRR